MGGMAAVYAGDEYNTRLKNVGGLSPAKSYYLGESSGTSGWGFRYYAKDIHFAEDADVYLSAGVGEQNGDFLATINRYEQGIAYNDPDVVTKFVAPSGWGNHSWNLAQKEIFMYALLRLKEREGDNTISYETVQDEIGLAFCMQDHETIEMLKQLAKDYSEFMSYSDNAGIRMVQFTKGLDKEQVLNDYYEKNV